MDIRNFFNAKSKEQPVSKNVPIKNRPKPLISDSSDEEMVGGIQHDTESVLKVKLKNRKPKNDRAVEKKAHKRQLSDSSDDELEPVKQSNPTKQTKVAKAESDNKPNLTKNGTKSKTCQSSEVNTLKPVDAKDFFKKAATNMKPRENQKSPEKEIKKRKVEADQYENQDPQLTEMPKTKKPPIQQELLKRNINSVDVEQHDDTNFNELLLHMNDQKNKKSAQSEVAPDKTKANESNLAANKKIRHDIKSELNQGPVTSAKLYENSQSVEKNGKNVNISPPKTSLSTKTNGRFQPESKPIQVTPTSSQDGSISSQISNQGNSQMRNSSEKVSQLWVEKYKPTGTKNIIGQQGDRSNLKKLQNWLKGWDKHHGIAAIGKPPARPPPWGASKDDGAWAKAALLSGPPGVGKTTTSYLVAKEMGYEIMETNASDTRSKKALDTEISDAMSSKSVTGSSSRR